jgi:hypothetical protein
MGEIEENSCRNGDEDMVTIAAKIIGPSPPLRLIIPSSIKVHELRKLIAGNGRLPVDNLKLILRGNVLLDTKNGDQVYIQFKNGDSLIVVVKPKSPAKHFQDGLDEDEDDLKFQLPQSTSEWKKNLFSFLHHKLKIPDMVLMALFSLRLRMWIFISMWFIFAPVAHKWDLGPLYILGTGFAIIFMNLGKRQSGDMSAYSIFNEDFRELPGTLNADRLDRDIRAGQM